MREKMYQVLYGFITIVVFSVVVGMTPKKEPLLSEEFGHMGVIHTTMTDSIKKSLKRMRKERTGELANKYFSTLVTLTCYNATEEQCDESPLITATGEVIDLDRLRDGKVKWCAISRDLEKSIPMHSLIHIEGHGNYEVKDRMNKRHTNMVDILQHTDEKAFMEKGVRVKLLRKGNNI